MRAFALLMLAGCAAGPAVAEPRVMVEDFESGRARWKDAGSGWKKTTVEIVDGGVAGRRAARIEFDGGGAGPAWTDLTWPVDGWPAGAREIVFWARAPRPCRVLVKINLGPTHDDLEMWGREIALDTGWTEVVVPVDSLTTFIWGHQRGAAPDASRLQGIGFVESDFPVTFEVDRIGIR